MTRARSKAVVAVLAVGCSALLAASQQGGLWPVGGQNVQNTRFQSEETRIGAGNASQLVEKWNVPTDGDVSATPAVDGNAVYFPDWAGFIYAADRNTGQVLWKVKVQDVTGV